MRATASASRPKMASGSPCLPRCPTSPQRSFLAADWYLAWSYPLLSLPFLSASHLCSEVRVPGAVGQEAAGRSLRPDSGRCFLRWHLGPPLPPAIAAGSRGRKCAGLLSGRGIAGAGLAGPVSPWLSVAVSGRVSVGTGGVASIKAKALRLKVGRAQ